MLDFDKIWFHESTILDLSAVGDTMLIKVRGASIIEDGGDDESDLISVNVKITGIKDIVISGDSMEKGICMMHDDGEVVAFRRDGDSITLVAEWNDFKTRVNMTVVYKFICDDIQCTID